MRALLTVLARRRWAGVGLALAAEMFLLLALDLAPPSATIGVPAAVAAAIGGTVAVVFGVADGMAVATAGAITFAALGGWGAGELGAIGVWPVVVAAVGLFARRIERQRTALRQLVEAQEEERRALALTLHDDSAQTLVGALMTMRAGQAGHDPAEPKTAQARELISDTIRQLRRLALQLSPKALEDYGLAAALAHLAEAESTRSGERIEFTPTWQGRLSPEAEHTLFRFAQAGLEATLEQGAEALALTLSSARDKVAVTISAHADEASATTQRLPSALHERLRLLDGKLSTHCSSQGELVLRAELPANLQLVGRVNSAA